MIHMGKQDPREDRKQLFVEIGILFLLSLLPLFWLKSGEVVMGHDSGFRLNFLTYYKSLLYAWNPVMNFGIDWQLYKGFLMTQLPEFIGTTLTGSWVIGQRMMMVFWFFVIQLSMYYLAKTLRPEKEHWIFRMSASIMYAFNFFILQAWFIVERAKFSLYAALPLSVLLFYMVFVRKKNIGQHAILFGLLYFFMGGGGSPPLYGATLVVWAVTFLFFSVGQVRKNRIAGLFFSTRVLLAFGLAFFGINAYWIIPQAGLYLSTYKTAVAERGGVEGLIAWERVNSKNASILNLLRLQGIPDWYDNPSNAFAGEFLKNPILILASFIQIISICLGILYTGIKKIKHTPIVYLALIIFGIGLLLGGGSHPPFGIVYEYAMRHVPGFAIFRSSFYKFGPMVWFSIIFLSMYFVDILIISLTRNLKVRLLCGLILIAGILSYHHPFFVSDFFQFHKEFSTRVRIPEYVKNVSDFTNINTDPNARILVLPELTSSFYNIQMDAYQWKFFSLDILPRNAIDRSIIANDNNAPEVIRKIYTEFMDGTREGFMKLADYAGIRYILWRDDAKYSDTVTEGRTIAFQKDRLNQFFPKPLYQNGAWQLYDTGNASHVPLIWTPREVFVTHHPIENPSELLLSRDSSKSAVLEGTDFPEDVIEANCLYCESGVYEKMVRETPLLSLRFEPGTPFFQRLVDSDSQAIEQAGTDPEALFNALISHSQFQLAILSSAKKPASYDANKIVEDIKATFDTIKKQLAQLKDRQKNVYATRLLLYSDVSKRYIARITTLTEFQRNELNTYFDGLKNSVDPLVWMTKSTSDIRYEFETATDSIFEAVITNTRTPLPSIEIDNVTYEDYRSITIASGYHRARMMSPSIDGGFVPQLFFKKIGDKTQTVPSVTFKKVSPTKYFVEIKNATKPYILVLNESFDRRWQVHMPSENFTVQGKDHGKVNGFGNGWYMEKTGDYTLEISYWPQKLFIIGAFVTGISILIGMIFFCRIRK